tara:strand:- start:181 stop:852 length:672 start_codon:yes stop_codon:yes gene_type:complete
MLDLNPIILTALLASVTTTILLFLGTPIAWWLANAKSRLKPVVETLTALPLVLPPTVLGFYLLILLNPNSVLGKFWIDITGNTLTFSFSGLVIASVFYSLPFMVQPLQRAFQEMGKKPLEIAASLGASPRDAFFTVALPTCKRGFLTSIALTFAHTVGEFGVVLMVGGNIPGETKVLSIAIYEYVETMQYQEAHKLSAGLLIFSFAALFALYSSDQKSLVRIG